jgi:hypothetical protein
MKQILFIVGLIVALTFTLGCLKDEVETPVITPVTTVQESGIITLDGAITDGVRIGEGDLIFFRNSLTTDNYLAIKNNEGRSHRAYNASTIAYIQFDLGLNNVFNIYAAELTPTGGIVYKTTKYKHYKAFIQYKDSTKVVGDKLTVYSKDTVNNFKIYPKEGFIKITSPSIRWIEWRRDDAVTFVLNNEFRGTRYSGWVWDIYRNTEFFEQKPKEPTNTLSNQFQPDHRN